MKRLILPLLLIASLMVGGGCATATKPESMAVTPSEIHHQHATSVSVNVTGGKETSAAGASQIADADIKAAIIQSIRQSKLFETVGPAANYRLDVFLARLSQPKFGFSMTVTLEMNWTLTQADPDQVIWQRGIATTYTAKTGEAFAGVKRLRLATEGAARMNIQEALAAISSLDLP